MSYLEKRWQLHTPDGAASVLDGSRFAFDRAWAPQGSGSLRLALDAPAAAQLAEYARTPLLLVCELLAERQHVALADLDIGAASLGGGVWPTTPTTPYAPPGAPAQQSTSASWYVYPRRIRRDRVEHVLEVEVATAELLLVEARNGGLRWQPTGLRAGNVYRVTDVLLELTRYVGVQLLIEPSTATVPADEVPPWEPGESAWEWFDALRMLAGLSYRFDPHLNRIRFVPAAAGGLPAVLPDWLRREDIVGGGQAEGLAYADAVEVLWQWTERDGTEREQREVALAPGVTSWRTARAWATYTKRGRPIPQWAAHRVAVQHRMRNLTTVELPLDATTLVDLGTGRGSSAQSIAFAIDEQPTVTMTLVTEN